MKIYVCVLNFPFKNVVVEERGWEPRKMRCVRGTGGRREKRQEVGVLKGWEAGEMGENYTRIMFYILQSKKA